MGMDELSMMMDLAGEVRVALVRGFEDDLGAIGEFVGGEVDLSERALSDQAAEGVVADRSEVLIREFAEREGVVSGQVTSCLPERFGRETGDGGRRTYSRSSWYEDASWST